VPLLKVRANKGRDVASPALLLTFIHRSAWKVDFPKLDFRFTALSRKFA
jgi:hypothetical protein